jgi:hypothetical protein
LERRICALALAVPDEVHLLGTFGDWSIMRHAYSEDSAAHGGLHAGGDRAEGCHVLFHLRDLMGFALLVCKGYQLALLYAGSLLKQ